MTDGSHLRWERSIDHAFLMSIRFLIDCLSHIWIHSNHLTTSLHGALPCANCAGFLNNSTHNDSHSFVGRAHSIARSPCLSLAPTSPWGAQLPLRLHELNPSHFGWELTRSSDPSFLKKIGSCPSRQICMRLDSPVASVSFPASTGDLFWISHLPCGSEHLSFPRLLAMFGGRQTHLMESHPHHSWWENSSPNSSLYLTPA